MQIMASMNEKVVNFSQEELFLLLPLIEKHAAIVEDKRNSASSIKRIREAWDTCARKFNSNYAHRKEGDL